jgi:hypothetical protein
MLSMRALRLSAHVASAALMFHAASVNAAPKGSAPAMSVLELATDDADDQAKALTAALKARVRESKDHSLAEGDVSLSVVLLALKCGDVPDVGCQQRIAEKLSAERYIWGTMRKAPGSHVIADLHFWQKDKPEVRQQFTYSDNLTEPSDAALTKLADQMLSRLTQFGKVGVVRLSAAEPKGDLYVDGQPIGKLTDGQAELSLPVGDHRIELRKDGRIVAAGTTKVSATTPVDLALAPAARTEGDGDRASGSSGSWKKTAGYVGIGVGGAFIAAGVYSQLRVNSINGDEKFDAYRRGFGANADICDAASRGTPSRIAGAASPSEAKDMCDTGSTFQTLQFVFYGLGAVSAGAGIYLLATADKDKDPATSAAPRVRVLPGGGRDRAGVDVRVSF